MDEIEQLGNVIVGTDKRRVAVLISGRGSNMVALAKACEDPAFPAEISVVISNTPKAQGLAIATDLGLTTEILDHTQFSTREAFDAALHAIFMRRRIEIVCLAGFMRLLTPGLTQRWAGYMINIHPSLLPALKGLKTHERALAEGAKHHGCTVHFVTPGMDEGPVIVQAKLDVLPGDTPETLSARVLTLEHRCYPLALRWLASGAISYLSGQTQWQAARPDEPGLIIP